MRVLSRRTFLTLLPAGGAALAAWPAPGFGEPSATGPVPDAFPQTEPSLALQVVGAAHVQLDKLRPLVEAQPALANAAIDWGFGDWETAIGACSHTGRRDIAEFLMVHGARPDLFTFTMLGQLDAVRGAIEASPGLQRTKGPHGITLLAHARAGGEAARDVLAYLESLGDADRRDPNEPLSEEERVALIGAYAWGVGESERWVVAESRSGVSVARAGGPARPLIHKGAREFHPGGSPQVRVRFEPATGPPERLIVEHAGRVVRGVRAGG